MENLQQQEVGFKKTLGFGQLVLYGVIFMTPLAGIVYYGTNQQWANGYAYLGYIFASIVMIFVVLCYQVMVKEFPGIGSAYTYTAKGINGKIGFVIGWNMLLAYGCVIFFVVKLTAVYINSVIPAIPVWALVVGFSIIITVLTAIGINVGIGVQIIVGAIMIIFIVYECALGIHAGIGHGGLARVAVQMDQVNMVGIFQVSTLAILNFVGFDGITTLGEESKIESKKFGWTLMVAVIIQAVILTGSTFCLTFGQDWKTIPENQLEMAYGYLLAQWSPAAADALIIIVNIAMIVVALGSMTAFARVLYSMSRVGVMPKSFGKLHPKFRTPFTATIVTGVITLVASLVLDWLYTSQIVSAAASIGFIAVPVAVIVHMWIRKKQHKFFQHLLFPLIAIVALVVVMTTIDPGILIVTGVYIAVGIVVLIIGCVTSKRFRDGTNEVIEDL